MDSALVCPGARILLTQHRLAWKPQEYTYSYFSPHTPPSTDTVEWRGHHLYERAGCQLAFPALCVCVCVCVLAALWSRGADGCRSIQAPLHHYTSPAHLNQDLLPHGKDTRNNAAGPLTKTWPTLKLPETSLLPKEVGVGVAA